MTDAPKGALARYLRHAELYGAEQVFETAAEDPEFPGPGRHRAHDLALLAAGLRKVDARWRLKPSTARWLACALAREGFAAREIATKLRLSVPTARRYAQAG